MTITLKINQSEGATLKDIDNKIARIDDKFIRVLNIYSIKDSGEPCFESPVLDYLLSDKYEDHANELRDSFNKIIQDLFREEKRQ